MPKDTKTLHIVIASPSDVQAEREIVPAVVDEVNAGVADERDLVLKVTRWERDAFPGFHREGPQALIDSILRIPECDIFLGIFWKRFGTPVADSKSGTAHEYKQAYEAWKQKGSPQIFFYFKEKPYAPKTNEEIRQWGLVLEFKEHFPQEGLWWLYKGQAHFRELLRHHLESFLRKEFPLKSVEHRLHPQHDTIGRSFKPEADQGGVTTSNLTEKIRYYETYVENGLYDIAWTYFRDDLNYVLDFLSSQNRKHLELLLRLLPKGENDPRLASIKDKPGVFNALGRAYKNIGRPTMAVDLFQRQLELQYAKGHPDVRALGNLANALRLSGQLFEAENMAGKMFEEATRLNQPIWEAYSLYWNGVLLAGRGSIDDGTLLLEQAQVLFEDINDSVKHEGSAGAGRVYAHLAQIELWLGNPKMALAFARNAWWLVQQHHQHREKIFVSRLIGVAKLLLGDNNGSWKDLRSVLKEAEDCGYFEEQLAATIGLAELDRRVQNLPSARDRLSDDLRSQAEAEKYSLLLSDFDNTLCQIQQDRRHHVEAVEAATRAYRQAWCDGPPFSYYWGLMQATSHLVQLGAPLPAMPNPTPSLPQSDPTSYHEVLDSGESVRAHLRAEFIMLLRTITGPYRYAPTKFIKMLREDWSAIRNIVTGKTVSVGPQFVEIHVGEPCNLACIYCRGLRMPCEPSEEGEAVRLPEGPGATSSPGKPEKFLEKAAMLRLLESIYQLNSRAFIRFSGLIGEPLLYRDIEEVFDAVNAKGLRWGLTTNGVYMEGEKLRALLLKAMYVHVSVDAGTDETYATLKKGKPGTLEKVLENVRYLAECRPGPEVIVSFLLQETNYKELLSLANRVKAIGVDTLEIKMQHFDLRRRMSESAVNEAYDLIDGIRRDLSCTGFRVVVVQKRDEAFRKIRDGQRISFERCYANLLGLNATIDPRGNVQMCCQYYQRTLESAGNVESDCLNSIWWHKRLNTALQCDPRGHCISCSPSDEFINRFVQFLREAHKSDASFLDWVEKETLIGTTEGGL
jgi:MoaA/NifB/PqqE/SkfB family radical SAM enzyme/tetratricopeptide (TPR) repeat protein